VLGLAERLLDVGQAGGGQLVAVAVVGGEQPRGRLADEGRVRRVEPVEDAADVSREVESTSIGR
jgi:hypothetical protein